MSRQQEERSKEKKNHKTVQGLADKLQQGWAMLGQCCPQCNTPLVREKNGKRIFCVTCDLWVVRESDLDAEQLAALNGGSSASAPQAAPVKAAAKPAREKTIEELEAGLASLSDHREYGRISGELRDENDIDGVLVSSEEEDEPAPKSATQRKLDDYARSKQERAAADAEDEDAEYATGPALSSAQVDTHMGRINDLSSKLGAKMLQGWTMLADACPNDECACPLMRARGETSTMLCVNCGSTVVKEGDDLRIVKTGGKTPASSTAATKVATPAPAPVQAPTTKLVSASSIAVSHSRSSSARKSKTRRQRFEDDDVDSSTSEEEDESDAEQADLVQTPSAAQAAFDVEDPYSTVDLPADFSDSRGSSLSFTPAASPAGVVDPSAKIGQLMMQGYALLAQHCPRDDCNCPLVRKRDGPMLCVKCGSTVVDQSEYDEAVHGRAENIEPAASTTTAAAPKPSAKSATPVKRTASPGLNQLRAEEQSADKRGRVDSSTSSSKSPSFQSTLSSTPLMRSPVYPAERGSEGASGTTSTESSPASHSRAWSMELEAAEAAVDPRLRQQAQLGGKRGRFNAPKSRAPSLAVGGMHSARHTYTSSAALNAAAQMAFGGAGAASATANGKRSGPSSLEQSPLVTPWPTPNVPSMSLSAQRASSASPPFAPFGGAQTNLPQGRYPPSRHNSVSLGAAQPFSPAGRGSLMQAHQQQQQQQQAVQFGEDAPAQAQFASAAAPSQLAYSSVLQSTHDALVAKLDECRARLVAVDGASCRDLMATMRDLLATIQVLQDSQAADL